MIVSHTQYVNFLIWHRYIKVPTLKVPYRNLKIINLLLNY